MVRRMLLSMLVSLLLAKRFHGKIYVLLMAVGLVLTSFFSVGVPSYHFISKDSAVEAQSGILLDNPLPLSFPIYASLNLEWRALSAWTQHYQLYFLTFIFYKNKVQSQSLIYMWLFLSWGDYILYYSFFLIVNFVGAVIGYWLSKTTFIDKLLAKIK